MNMNSHRNRSAIISALPIVARGIASKYGVQVRIGGDRAYTDGNVIQLPAMPVAAEEATSLDAFAKFEALAWGYLAHESAHIKCTDMQAWKTISSEAEHAIANAIEDIFIEREIGEQFPGARRDLATLVKFLDVDGHFNVPSATDTPLRQLSAHVLYRARSEVLGQALFEDKLDQTGALIAETFGDGVRIKIDALIGQVRNVASTEDSIGLARQILTALEEEDPPESQDPQDQRDQGGQGDGESSGSDTSAEGGDQTGNTSASTPSQPQTAQQKANAQAARQGSKDEAAADIGAAAAEAMDSAAEQAEKDGCPIAGALPEPGGAGTGSYKNVPGAIDLQATQAATARIRSDLAGRLDAICQGTVDRSQRGGKLDTKRLHTALLPQSRLFKRTTEERNVDTAVQLLLDRSGSMDGPRIEVARAAMLSAALAIESIDGCSVAAAAFPFVHRILRFGERAARNAVRFGINADGGTPLTEALWAVGEDLHNRPESRKLLVVMTDGQPNNQTSAKATIRALRSIGIEVIGIGIQIESIEHLFGSDDYEVINSLAEFPRRLLTLLERRLLESLGEAA
jgi:cobalamin biosynthesis protein CobT